MFAISDRIKQVNNGFVEKLLLGLSIIFAIIVLGLFSAQHYIGIALILVTIFLLLIIHNYKYGLYFIVICLPLFQSVSMKHDSASATGINLQYILIPVLFFSWILEKITKKELSKIKLPYLYLFLTFLGVLAFTIVNQMDIVAGKMVIKGFIQVYSLANYIILFYIIVNEKLETNDIKNILSGFLFVALIAAFIGIYQYFRIDMDDRGGLRVTSIFGSLFREDTKMNPNAFGTYLVFMLAITLFFWNTIKSKYRYNLIILTVILFCALILSFSRSSLLALLFVIFCYTYYHSKKAFLITVLIAIIGLIALFFEPTFQDRFGSIITIITNKSVVNMFLQINPQTLDWSYVEYYGIGGYNSNVISGAFRIWAWFQGFFLFQSHPFLGIGYHLTMAFSPWPTSENLYLDMISMTGICGFSLFIMIQVVFIRDGFRLLKLSKFSHSGMLWLTILATVFFVSLTGSILFDGKLLGIFFIIAGVFYNIKLKVDQNNALE